MAAPQIFKTKTFQAGVLSPLATPDGTSLEEQVNVFLATKVLSNILSVDFPAVGASKYGITTSYLAVISYKE